MFSRTYIIAEIGQAHDGSLGILHSYIDEVSKTGADAIKFQMHYAASESSSFEKFRIPFSYEDKTRYDYWKRMELTLEQWIELKKHCTKVGLDFLVSPFSVKAVNYLEKIGVNHYKIASGEVTNYLMLKRIADTKKPLLISTGMSDFDEIEKTLTFLDTVNASKKRLLFQCTTSYPTKPSEVGINVINELKSKFKLPVGLSDHSGEIFPSLASIMLGVQAIEAHIVFNKNMFGPDSMSSLERCDFKKLVDGIRFIEEMIDCPVDKNEVLKYEDMKINFGKSLSASNFIPKNHKISINDLESKKPSSKGIFSKDYQKIIGKRINKDLKKGDFIKMEYFDET